MTESLSRRAFFGQATVGAAVGAVTATAVRPERAWIIMAVDWQHNDEWSSPEGAVPRAALYYDYEQAQTACQRLCDEFFTVEYPTPLDFEPDWRDYDLPRGPDFDESQVTWAELRAAGFEDPFFVKELIAAEPLHE